MMRAFRLGALATLAAACLGAPAASAAGERNQDAVVLRARLRDPAPEPAPSEPDTETLLLLRQVDAALHEAVQDLGLSVDVSGRGAEGELPPYEALVERAASRWVFSPRLERRRGRLRLEIVAVRPGSSLLLVRAEEVEPEDLEMRVMTMMRDLVEGGRPVPSAEKAPVRPPPRAQIAEPAHSPGQAVLAFNAALLGGYVGFSLERTSESEDHRLAYPLVAIGAGVGLGSSVLASEEWDIGMGDAWFLSAGMWWPTAGALLFAKAEGLPEGEQHANAVLAALAGTTLATTVIAFGHVSEGGAALTHSGGAFGTLLGGITELAVRGEADETPRHGMGAGAVGGVLLAGALATKLDVTPTRVVLVDLGASLGALTGAAAASPLLLVDESQRDPARDRLWLGSVAVGTLAGGTIAYFMTEKSTKSGPTKAADASSARASWPSLGVVGVTPEGPAYGLGFHGAW